MEELQTLYSAVYPNSRIKINKEDLKYCDIDVENNNYEKICEAFERINNRIDVSKTSSMQTSEIFVTRLLQSLQPYNKEIYGTIEPFCDNREQGLVICLCNIATNDSINIWSFESRTDKDLTIVVSDEKTKENLFMDDAYDKAQYFKNNNFDDAITYSISQVDKFLGRDLNVRF